jgi:uncharacterized protein
MKGFRYFVDTNIFLRFFVRDVPTQADECEKFFKWLITSDLDIYTSSLVVGEIVWTLSSYYSRKKSEVIEVVEAVTDILGGRIEDDHRIEVASEIYKEYSVKFIDALIASSPSILSGETIVVSYDKDFDKIGIKRLEPSDFIKSKRLNN